MSVDDELEIVYMVIAKLNSSSRGSLQERIQNLLMSELPDNGIGGMLFIKAGLPIIGPNQMQSAEAITNGAALDWFSIQTLPSFTMFTGKTNEPPRYYGVCGFRLQNYVMPWTEMVDMIEGSTLDPWFFTRSRIWVKTELDAIAVKAMASN